MENYILNNWQQFATGFYGYGAWGNPVWAIGLEERGCHGDTALVEAYNRINAWNQQPAELRQLNEYHQAAGLPLLGCLTWNRLAQLCAPILGLNANDHQQQAFCADGGIADQIILTEAQPLACPNNAGWPWGQWIPYPGKSAWLRDQIIRERMIHLGQKLAEVRGLKLCVLYGRFRKDHVDSLIEGTVINGNAFQLIELPWNADEATLAELLANFAPRSSILNLPHPNRRHLRPGFYTEVGAILANQ